MVSGVRAYTWRSSRRDEEITLYVCGAGDFPGRLVLGGRNMLGRLRRNMCAPGSGWGLGKRTGGGGEGRKVVRADVKVCGREREGGCRGWRSWAGGVRHGDFHCQRIPRSRRFYTANAHSGDGRRSLPVRRGNSSLGLTLSGRAALDSVGY